MTNTAECLYDGGDCCLPRKVSSLCENCTCTIDIDIVHLRASLKEVNAIKYYLESLVEFAKPEVVLHVQNVLEEDVCSTLCLDKTLKNVVSWLFDENNETCSCLSVFEKYQCNWIQGTSFSSQHYIQVMESKTCTMTCGNESGRKFLSQSFTNLWGEETYFKGCIEGNLAQGRGEATTENNWLFNGDWQQGLLEGSGTGVNSVTGESYKGHWSNGQFHGYGELEYSYGDYYIGSFVKGKRSGQGRLESSVEKILPPYKGCYDINLSIFSFSQLIVLSVTKNTPKILISQLCAISKNIVKLLRRVFFLKPNK